VDRSVDSILGEALSSYRSAHRSYHDKRYADSCLKAYDTAYKLIKVYALTRGLHRLDNDSSKLNLLELALNLEVTDPEVLQELSLLSFIHIHFNYPELQAYSGMEFREATAKRCLKAAKTLARRLLKTKLTPLDS
jgi:HEPN domain.